MTHNTEIEIFRTGQHTDANGCEVLIDSATLDRIAACYDATLHEAPLVLGHPKDDKPAWGWVQSLRRRGKSLLATLQHIAPEVTEAVRKGQYKKVSASFYRPEAPHNPVPKEWYLRHIGLLGAQTPAVKGLAPLKFAEDDQACVANTVAFQLKKSSLLDFLAKSFEQNGEQNFEQNNKPSPQEIQGDRQWKQILLFADRQIECGKILPCEKTNLIALIASLDEECSAHFQDESPRAWLCNFIEQQPRRIPLETYSEETLAPPQDDGIAIAQKASRYMQRQAAKGRIVSATEAVRHVTT